MAITFHELRNPLNGTEGYLRLASERALSLGSCLADGGVDGVVAAAVELELLAHDIESSVFCTHISLRFLNTLSSVQKLIAGPEYVPTVQHVELSAVAYEVSRAS